MLSSKKIQAVASVFGLAMPRLNLVLSSFSTTSLAPTFSDLTRAIASTGNNHISSLNGYLEAVLRFSSSDSHFAVSGRSVSVKNAMSARPQVMMPSIRKILRQLVMLPISAVLRIAPASRPGFTIALIRPNSERYESSLPPKAPARGAVTR